METHNENQLQEILNGLYINKKKIESLIEEEEENDPLKKANIYPSLINIEKAIEFYEGKKENKTNSMLNIIFI